MGKIEFPKYMYHADKEPIVVKSKEEKDALGKGWAESPAKAVEAPKEVKEKVKKIRKPKGK